MNLFSLYGLLSWLPYPIVHLLMIGIGVFFGYLFVRLLKLLWDMLPIF